MTTGHGLTQVTRMDHENQSQGSVFDLEADQVPLPSQKWPLPFCKPLLSSDLCSCPCHKGFVEFYLTPAKCTYSGDYAHTESPLHSRRLCLRYRRTEERTGVGNRRGQLVAPQTQHCGKGRKERQGTMANPRRWYRDRRGLEEWNPNPQT